MDNTHIHWRNVYQSDFLAAWDLDDKEEILTIAAAEKKECMLSRGKEIKVVISFKEKHLSNGVEAKPMICNPTNSKNISKKTGSGMLSDWVGFQIVLSKKKNTGKIGNEEGLWIKDVLRNKTEKPTATPINIDDILKETNLDKARQMAHAAGKQMTPEQVAKVSQHIKTLSQK